MSAELKEYFSSLAEFVSDQRQADEFFLLNLEAENTHFVRFNHALIRQPSSVEQAVLSITWIQGKKQIGYRVNLTLNHDADKSMLSSVIKDLRHDLQFVEEDPYLMYQTEVINSNVEAEKHVNDPNEICEQILHSAKGRDLVGLLTAGKQISAFANANGQLNWYEFNDLNMDWSVYLGDGGDKAAKGNYATDIWSQAGFENQLRKTIDDAESLKVESKRIERGSYRAYLSSSAVSDLLMFSHFSYDAWRNKTNLWQRWHDGEVPLSEKLTLNQNVNLGVAANFQSQGFISKDLALINKGSPAEKLISPRSGAEYKVEHNGANEGETSNSIEVSAGELATQDALEALDTGLLINNLHYLNVSDLTSARITGMTRFACFWVENGKIIAPIDVMRFDDSLYRLLGSELVDLTQERQRIVSDSTYFQRGRGGSLLPGALIGSMKFTL